MLQNAPMAYYKFLTKFALILGLLSNVINIISLLGSDPYWLDISYNLVVILLCFASLVLLKRMEWIGVLTLCGMYFLGVIYNALVSIVWLEAGLDPVELISRAVVLAIFLILTWIYFCKRRPLFHPYQVTISKEQYEAQEAQRSYPTESAFVNESVPSPASPEDHPPLDKCQFHRYETFFTCPACGSLVPKGSYTCDCGYVFRKFRDWKKVSCWCAVALALLIILVGSNYASYRYGQKSVNEQFAQTKVDAIIREIFEGQLDPFTGKSLETEADYRAYQKAFAAHNASN